MIKRVVLSKSVKHTGLHDLVDRDIKMESLEDFLKQVTKLAKKEGWELETFDLMFTRPNKDCKYASDCIFINTYQ